MINFEFEYLSGQHHEIEHVDDPIFALLHVFFAKKNIYF